MVRQGDERVLGRLRKSIYTDGDGRLPPTKLSVRENDKKSLRFFLSSLPYPQVLEKCAVGTKGKTKGNKL